MGGTGNADLLRDLRTSLVAVVGALDALLARDEGAARGRAVVPGGGVTAEPAYLNAKDVQRIMKCGRAYAHELMRKAGAVRLGRFVRVDAERFETWRRAQQDEADSKQRESVAFLASIRPPPRRPKPSPSVGSVSVPIRHTQPRRWADKADPLIRLTQPRPEKKT